MIQELFSGERKISITSEGFLQATSSPTCTTTTTTTTTTTPTTTTPSNPSDSTQQTLRCPRCDSTNTKFCYYNNYNLTQPRHFCKTCRRYWTKGGALRNVPIGGGCRKNKISTPPTKASSAYAKLRTSLSSLSSESGFDHDLSSNQAIPWPSPPPPLQNSHILAFLRAAQNPNPNNPNPNGPQFSMAPPPPPSSLWRTTQQPTSGFGEAQHNSGIQELFQKLKSSRVGVGGGGGLYYGNPQPVSLSSNVVMSSSSSSSNPSSNGVGVLESVPAAGGEFSYLNSAFSWSDVVTPSAGAYP